MPIRVVTAPKVWKTQPTVTSFSLVSKLGIADLTVNCIYKNIGKKKEEVRTDWWWAWLRQTVWQEEDVLVFLWPPYWVLLARVPAWIARGGVAACPERCILGFCVYHMCIYFRCRLGNSGYAGGFSAILSPHFCILNAKYFKSSIHLVSLWTKYKLQRTSLPKPSPDNGEWTKAK